MCNADSLETICLINLFFINMQQLLNILCGWMYRKMRSNLMDTALTRSDTSRFFGLELDETKIVSCSRYCLGYFEQLLFVVVII